MASAEERRLFAAVKAAESRAQAMATPTCRHGFPLPQERISRSFVDPVTGERRWTQVWHENREATCPDE